MRRVPLWLVLALIVVHGGCAGTTKTDPRAVHPDVQLQVRAPGQEGVQAALGAPGEVAAQIRVGVGSGGALEPG